MGEWENRKGGRASSNGGYGNSVRDTQTRARETDCGRRRQTLYQLSLDSVSCLLQSLFAYPLTSIAQVPSLCPVCPCQFKTPRRDKGPAATTTTSYESHHFLLYPHVVF